MIVLPRGVFLRLFRFMVLREFVSGDALTNPAHDWDSHGVTASLVTRAIWTFLLGLVVHEVRHVVDRVAYLAYLSLALDRGDALAGEAYLLAYLVPTSTRKQDGVPLEFLDDSPTPRGLFAFISFHGFEKGY